MIRRDPATIIAETALALDALGIHEEIRRAALTDPGGVLVNVEELPTQLKKGSVIFSDGENLAEDNPNLTYLDEVLTAPGMATKTMQYDVEVEALEEEPEGLTWWNTGELALNVATGIGPVAQLPQEQWVLVYNDTLETFNNGEVLRPVGVKDLDGILIGTFEKAKADVFSTVEGTIVMATMDIPPETRGIATRFGKVRGIDTSTLTPGADLYVSEDVAGAVTNTRPSFPNYAIKIGAALVADAEDGEIVISVTTDVDDTFGNFWNGTFRESFDFRVTSDGATITGSLEPTNGHPDMTMVFSDGFTIFDTAPPATIELTPGTDENPQTNFVYITKANKVLEVSTSSWPFAEEHIKVAQIYLQSAATTEAEGTLRNQNWNDEVQDTTTNQGHLSHIDEKLRQFEAQWDSGAEGSVDIGVGDEVWVKNTSGVVYQVHRQAFPAQDTTQYSIDAVNQGNKTFTISGDGDLTNTFTDGKQILVHDSTGNDGMYTVVSTLWNDPNFVITVSEAIPSAVANGTIGDDIHVVNSDDGAFTERKDLSDETNDASGNPLLNTSFSVVVWGVANKDGEPQHLMANMPIGTYNKNFPNQAVVDADASAVYNIPKEFQGVGFLIARFTFVNTSGVWSLYQTQDLRGFVPNTTAGAGAGASGITTFLGLVDTPSTYTGQAGNLARVAPGETALDFASDIDIGGADFTTTGDITTDDLTVQSEVKSGLVPDMQYTYDLGADGFEWNELHVGEIHCDGSVRAFDILADNYYDQAGNFQWGFTDGAGNISILGEIQDNSDVLSIDPTNRAVYEGGGDEVFNWQTLNLLQLNDSALTTTGVGTFGGVADVVQLIAKGNASQTTIDIFQIQDGSGVKVMGFFHDPSANKGSGISWADGSVLFEQTDAQGTARMLYKPNGDRFEVLNEAGNAFLMGVHGANSAKPTGTRIWGGLVVGDTAAASNDIIDDGIQADGDIATPSNIGAGTLTPNAKIHGVGTASVAFFERIGLSADTISTAFQTKAVKTTNMGDGFGVSQNFLIEDNAGVENPIGTVGFARDGADNTGAIRISAAVVGNGKALFAGNQAKLTVFDTGVTQDRRFYITGGSGGSGKAILQQGTVTREWETVVDGSPYNWHLDYVGTDAALANIISATKAGIVSFVNDISVESNKRVNLEGSSGDTYIIYNTTSGDVEIWKNGSKVASW